MDTVKISALNAANTIDGAADYLPIVTASIQTTQKINRNTFLNIASQPVGEDDTQELSHKTIGNTNSITLASTGFVLQDASDNTKQLEFSLSNITTATTRTITFPNASVTLASLSGTETLTNKTLTSPAITGGTYDNGAITVDSISGHTTSTIVTVGGVQMNNGTIGTSGAVTSTSIATGAVTPAALTSGTGSSWAWQTWTPTLANITLGNGVQTARYIQIGKTVFFEWKFVLGNSGSAIGTGPTISLPVTAASSYAVNDLIGKGFVISGGANFFGVAGLTGTTGMRPLVWGASTYVGTVASFTASVPGSWTTSDQIQLQGFYEAA